MTPGELIGRLEHVSETGNTKWRWRARCPAHDDTDPSLSIGLGDDGKLLLWCHAGCDPLSILARLNLTPDELWTRPRPSRRIILDDETPGASGQHHGGCTTEELAEDKGLPVELLRSVGMIDVTIRGCPAVLIPYCDDQGVERAIQYRVHLTNHPRFRWRPGAKPMLYGLPWLIDARAAGYALLVEGVTDTLTGHHHRIPTIGLPSAAGWKEEWLPYFEGIPILYAILEADIGGEHMERKLSQSALRDRIRFVRMDAAAKDLNALYLQDRAHFRATLQARLATAIPWQQVNESATQAEHQAAWRVCEPLAQEPDLLVPLRRDFARHGIAGEESFAQLVYLTTTSRFLEKPISLAAKGPSAAGKSFVIQEALKFFPESAYHALSAMSERALVYSQESMQHRMMVVYEAQGLEGDWASYLMRSLLSEGRIRYETVVKGENGPVGLLVERDGPTGLITTTTRIHLHPENETRLVSVLADDTPAQTRRVMRQIARATASPCVDLGPWRALQTWLAGAEHRTVIPYAATLAELIPPVAVRLRRDFGMLLSLIRTHAILHQVTRTRDGQGQIVAALSDYAAIRSIVADLLAEGVEAAVSPLIRETVAAVQGLTTAAGSTTTVKAVGRALGIETPAALRRVKMALEKGYLQNQDPARKRGQSYTLVLGDPLPENAGLLPPADHPRLLTPTPEPPEPSTADAALLPEPEPVASPTTGDNGNGYGRAGDFSIPDSALTDAEFCLRHGVSMRDLQP